MKVAIFGCVPHSQTPLICMRCTWWAAVACNGYCIHRIQPCFYIIVLYIPFDYILYNLYIFQKHIPSNPDVRPPPIMSPITKPWMFPLVPHQTSTCTTVSWDINLPPPLNKKVNGLITSILLYHGHRWHSFSIAGKRQGCSEHIYHVVTIYIYIHIHTFYSFRFAAFWVYLSGSLLAATKTQALTLRTPQKMRNGLEHMDTFWEHIEKCGNTIEKQSSDKYPGNTVHHFSTFFWGSRKIRIIIYDEHEGMYRIQPWIAKYGV